MPQLPSILNEPVWRTRAHLLGHTVPGKMACWLFDPASLTARLITACRDNFHVRVIRQEWARPMRNEAHRLKLSRFDTALIRQVYLHCGDSRWVFARTVIPRKTLSGRQKYLANLGSKPLGAVLFADPLMRRDEVEITCLKPGQRLFQAAVQGLGQQPDHIWGRRSVFYLKQKALLVSEIFLPTIAGCPAPG